MKKLLVSLLIAGMTLSLVACGSKKEDNNTSTETNTTQTVESQSPETNAVESEESLPETTDTTETNETQNGQADVSDTIGNALMEQFLSELEETPDLTAHELAIDLISNPILGDEFNAVTMEVQPGLLNGFDNAEITGFSEGEMFAPMIGSIPFVGYVFTLDADTDVDAFVENLRANANPRWNICTEADETVIEQSSGKVFFLMCPMSLDE